MLKIFLQITLLIQNFNLRYIFTFVFSFGIFITKIKGSNVPQYIITAYYLPSNFTLF